MPTKVKTKATANTGSTPPPVIPTSPPVTAPKVSTSSSKVVAPQPSAGGQTVTAPKTGTKAANQTTHNPRANQTPAVQHPTQQQPSAQPQQQPRPGAGDPAGGGAQSTRTKAGSVPVSAPQYTGPSWGQTPDQPIDMTSRPAIGTDVQPYAGPSWGNTQPAGTETKVYQGPGWANTQPEGTQPVPYQGPSWGNTQPAGTQTQIYQGPSWGNTQNTWTRQDFEAWRRGERDLTMPRLPIGTGLGNSQNFDRNPYNDEIIYPTIPAPVVDPAGGLTYPDGYDTNGDGYTDYWPQYGSSQDPWQSDGYGWGGRGGYSYNDYQYEPKDWFVGMQNWRF